MTQQTPIATNIKLLRERMGLSQEDLAKYLDVQREMISYFENGKREPSLKTLTKLANLFGLKRSELMESSTAIEADMAFAFRAENIDANDLRQIADFKKIVKNFIKMKSIKEKSDE